MTVLDRARAWLRRDPDPPPLADSTAALLARYAAVSARVRQAEREQRALRKHP